MSASRLNIGILFSVCLALFGCESTELGDTPTVPPTPTLQFSQKGVCLDGTSQLGPVDANQLMTNLLGSLPVGRATFSLWIKMKSNSPRRGIVVSMLLPGGNEFRLEVLENSSFRYGTRANSISSSSEVLVPRIDQWHHVVISFDGSNPTPNMRKTMYLDGQLVGQDTHPIEYNPLPGQNLFISDLTQPMDAGCLDDIRYWQRQLTSAEVAELYATQKPEALTSTLTDVKASWLGEQDLSSTTLTDVTSGLDLPLSSGATFKSVIEDPFATPGLGDDPLSNPTGGGAPDGGSGGSGSAVFDGGSGGYGGEFGDGGSANSGGTLFP